MAKFVKLKYPKLVIDELLASEGDYATALRESFHKVDELLEDMVSSVAEITCMQCFYLFAQWGCQRYVVDFVMWFG